MRKTIRFTEKEYAYIKKQLEENEIDFTSFAKKSMLNKRIQSGVKIRNFHLLVNVKLLLDKITLEAARNGHISLLYKLSKIEKMFKELL